MTDQPTVDYERRTFVANVIATVGLAGCGGGGGSEQSPSNAADTTPPTLASSTPAANATAVSRTPTIELSFSESVSAPPGSVTLSASRGSMPISLTTVGNKVTVVPQRPLAFGEQHTLVATSAVRDAAGNAYAGSSASFTPIVRNQALALGAIVMDTYVRRRWTDPTANPWDVLPTLFDNGIEWLRVAVTTQTFPELRATTAWHTVPWRSEYWSCLEVSGALLSEAAAKGLRLQAMLFLSHQAADGGRQPRPPEWTGLTEAEVATRIEQHAATVASYYKALGLNIEVFEIGNEIDFGVCGVRLSETVPTPPGVDPVNDPIWMRDNIWNLGAPLLKAAIRGVRSVYPTSKILLHVSGFGYSNQNVAATGFFQSMLDLAVPFDIVGLSFPYMYGGSTVPQPYFAEPVFIETLTRLSAFGKPIQIVEFSYPSSAGGATKTPAGAYPFTPAGQAAFITDLATAVRGRVSGIYYFYPDWYAGFDASIPELEGGGLFASPGTERPALDVFNAIAEGGLLS